MNNINYTKLVLLKNLINKKVKPNFELQHLYNSNCNYVELIYALQEYTLSAAVPYLASGISSYFNKQVDESGLSNLKLSVQDKEDAKFIASCFGKKINYSRM